MVEPQASLQLLDARAMGKPSAFIGQEQDWSRWCYAFESDAGLLRTNLWLVMERAAKMATEPVRLST